MQEKGKVVNLLKFSTTSKFFLIMWSFLWRIVWTEMVLEGTLSNVQDEDKTKAP